MVECSNQTLFEIQKKRIHTALLELLKSPLLHSRQREGISKYLSLKNQKYTDFIEYICTNEKEKIFTDSKYQNKIFKNINQNPSKLILSAGTTSNQVSFRPFEAKNELKYYESLLKEVRANFKINLKETFIINAYPAGISIPQNTNGIDIGPRPELIGPIIQRIQNHFKHIVFVGFPEVVKVLCSDLRWTPNKTLLNKIYFVFGGSWLPESFKNYLGNHFKVEENDIDKKILSFYGISEVGLNIGVENSQTRKIRLKIDNFAPMVFKLNLEHYYIEKINDELVVTSLLVNRKLPIVRYRTGDLIDVKMYDDNNIYLILKSRLKNKINKLNSYENFLQILFKNNHLFKYLSGRVKISDNALLLEIKTKINEFEKNKIKKIFKVYKKVKFIEKINSEKYINYDLLRKWNPYG